MENEGIQRGRAKSMKADEAFKKEKEFCSRLGLANARVRPRLRESPDNRRRLKRDRGVPDLQGTVGNPQIPHVARGTKDAVAHDCCLNSL